MAYFTIVLFGGLICVTVSALIAGQKNLSPGNGFVIGFLLGVIGIVITALRPAGLPKAPAGMRSVKCQRCNAVQNVPVSDPKWNCWQCSAAHQPLLAPPGFAPAAPGQAARPHPPEKGTC